MQYRSLMQSITRLIFQINKIFSFENSVWSRKSIFNNWPFKQLLSSQIFINKKSWSSLFHSSEGSIPLNWYIFLPLDLLNTSLPSLESSPFQLEAISRKSTESQIISIYPWNASWQLPSTSSGPATTTDHNSEQTMRKRDVNRAFIHLVLLTWCCPYLLTVYLPEDCSYGDN